MNINVRKNVEAECLGWMDFIRKRIKEYASIHNQIDFDSGYTGMRPCKLILE